MTEPIAVSILSTAPIEGNLQTIIYEPETDDAPAFHVQYDPVARFITVAHYQASDGMMESDFIAITLDELNRIAEAINAA